MRRADHLAAGLALAVAVATAGAKGEDAQRYAAEITLTQRAPFVVLPLDVAAYARSEARGLADLRVVDSRGERVPFAVLPAAPPAAAAETSRTAPLYALPPRKPGAALLAPMELRVTTTGVTVVQRGMPVPSAASPPPGWVVDLGDDAPERANARRLELQWSAESARADFSAAYRLEASADLQRWNNAGSGQLLRLDSPSGTLMHDKVALPPAPPRFVRIVWDDAASAPKPAGARLVLAKPSPASGDAPTRSVLRPVAAPSAADSLEGRALLFDLGGTLPVAHVDLDLGAGTRVAPVTLQARSRTEGAWLELGRHAFWRLERDDRVSRSEPIAVHAGARQIRVIGDARAARLDAATTQLVVHAQLDRVVFATQGEPPWKLLAGDARADNGALPIGSLVPDLARERERLGSATLGAWTEIPAAAARARDEARRAALRPWALWGVLVAGVALVGFMAWRLARKTAA